MRSVLNWTAERWRRCNSPQWAWVSLPRFPVHTQTQHSPQDSSGRVKSTTQGPLPDDTQHSRQTDTHATAGFEPAIPASVRPPTHKRHNSSESNKELVSIEAFCCAYALYCLRLQVSDLLKIHQQRSPFPCSLCYKVGACGKARCISCEYLWRQNRILDVLHIRPDVAKGGKGRKIGFWSRSNGVWRAWPLQGAISSWHLSSPLAFY